MPPAESDTSGMTIVLGSATVGRPSCHRLTGRPRGQASGRDANRVCWSRAAIDFATQIDVGGLEFDDPRADALFRAIHQSLPVRPD